MKFISVAQKPRLAYSQRDIKSSPLLPGRFVHSGARTESREGEPKRRTGAGVEIVGGGWVRVNIGYDCVCVW